MNNRERETLFAHPLNMIRQGLQAYATAHRIAYDSDLGDDYVLSENWKEIASGLLGLLNGETGNIDRGAFDSSVRDLARRNGIDLDK